MNRRSRTAAAWIALVAMLLAVLLPTVARAAADGVVGLEICSTGPAAPEGAPAAAALDHCPYCTLQGAGWAPPPAAPQGVAPVPASARSPRSPEATAPALRPHSTAAPRGPPARA